VNKDITPWIAAALKSRPPPVAQVLLIGLSCRVESRVAVFWEGNFWMHDPRKSSTLAPETPKVLKPRPANRTSIALQQALGKIASLQADSLDAEMTILYITTDSCQIGCIILKHTQQRASPTLGKFHNFWTNAPPRCKIWRLYIHTIPLWRRTNVTTGTHFGLSVSVRRLCIWDSIFVCLRSLSFTMAHCPFVFVLEVA
jgi:hypothetical protein